MLKTYPVMQSSHFLPYYNEQANDILMFRTSIPGHKECHLHNDVFGHYGEYCPRIVNGAFWHWWGGLPPYNDYAIRIFNEWNLLNTVKSGPNIELLDPWFMTILTGWSFIRRRCWS